ncbi:MAG: VCBS repeat-containing protein, partial [Phycisphaerales bacterium]|nr:VCBS repeat-containing protein [Phycisphaerales bacterium]
MGRTVIDGATGEMIWDADDSLGNAINSFLGPLPCVADLDEDGFQEVIAGNTLFTFDGQVIWQADVPDGLCAVGNVYGDEGPEVVIVSNGFLRILDPADGSRLWSRRLEGRTARNVGGAPTIADFDGDGQAEIGVAHGGAYGVYDPTCATGNPMCAGDGLLWDADTDDGSSAGTGSSLFDFNGDGTAEVVYNDEQHFWIFEGLTGNILFQHPNSSRTRSENPTIADVDNDGDAEIVFSANAEARFIREFWTDPGLEVWGDARGRWVGARRIWNQHSYHITNVDENGHIPAVPEASWRTHNSYRKNLREGGDVLVVPDLWGGEGSYECVGPDRARLTITVYNYGLERAGAGAIVGIYRGRPS